MPPPARSCDRMLDVHTRRTTRRAKVLEAHVSSYVLSCPPSLDSYTGDAVRCSSDATGGSPRVHTIAQTPAHMGTCSGAHIFARLPMSTSVMSHTRTASLSHALGLTQLCAHAHTHMHVHMHKARKTYHKHTRDTSKHTYTHEHAQRLAKELARTHTRANT